ncbi:MAG TPA: lysine 5,6-aminomutase subunit alpha [Candidatus Limnocylindrales bacterium]|nr:lysine 5,6-aminomutase subunit alpha [Candidatus Limnocylindrales bacterium]
MASTVRPGDLAEELEAVRARAAGVAEELGAAASASRTLGRERAILRLIGVGGIDREGRPLAAEVVDRYVSGHPDRLSAGAALPFAMALLEYDVGPQQLALDVAGGTVDLAMEAEVLARPDRRAAAEDLLDRLVAAALDRIDANRTARRELLGVLGDTPPPWIGTTLVEASADGATGEATELVRAGADVLRVEVPVGRELAMRLGELGQEVLAWRPSRDDDPDPAPSGSQRGLARLRDGLDRAAAERGAYVRLAMVPAALASPEGAIVAAFERADVLELDPMAEIVGTGVDPERALADFAFAVRVARRAGTAIQLGAGPLVVAPDLDAGVNSDPATRAGRALALQLLAVALARRDGLDDGAVIVGALPGWLVDEPDAAARAAAEVALRRALLAGHPLAFIEPGGQDASGRWLAIMAGVVPGEGAGLVLRRPVPGPAFGPVASGTRAIADVARELEASLGPRQLTGIALDHAAGCLASALRTFDRLTGEGWSALTGSGPGRGGWGRLGGDAVAPAGDRRDPVDRALG